MQQSQGLPPLPVLPAVARIPGAEPCAVSIDGITWRYWRAGTGPPLLLLHGFMGYSFCWRFNIASLARNFSVYAMDLPGSGFSQPPRAATCSLASDAESVLAFMDHLGIQRADIVASSRGGALAIALGALLARRNMLHRISKLVLVSPVNPWSSNGRLLTRLLGSAIGGWVVLNLLPRMHFLLAHYFKKLYADPRRIPPGSIEGYAAALKIPGSFRHILRIVRSWACDLKHVEESLPAISDVPTLLLWGSRDTAVYPSSASELQHRLRNSTLVMLEGVGHLPFEEAPEEFNRIVSKFLLEGKR